MVAYDAVEDLRLFPYTIHIHPSLPPVPHVNPGSESRARSYVYSLPHIQVKLPACGSLLQDSNTPLDSLPKLLWREGCVERPHPSWLGARYLLEPLLHPPHKFVSDAFDPAERRPRASGPPFPLLSIQAQIERQIRYYSPSGPGVQVTHRLHTQTSPRPLISEARIEKPLAEHHLFVLQTRQDLTSHQIRPRSRVQIRLGPRVHV